MAKQHMAITIHGFVQGVSFRYYTYQKATELDLGGFVRNDPDGTVYIEAEGEATALDELVEWCGQGPDLAQVSKVSVEQQKGLAGFNTFDIR